MLLALKKNVPYYLNTKRNVADVTLQNCNGQFLGLTPSLDTDYPDYGAPPHLYSQILRYT
jgi:hypothetical protein